MQRFGYGILLGYRIFGTTEGDGGTFALSQAPAGEVAPDGEVTGQLGESAPLTLQMR